MGSNGGKKLTRVLLAAAAAAFLIIVGNSREVGLKLAVIYLQAYDLCLVPLHGHIGSIGLPTHQQPANC